jgi:NADPH:quinone reductase-like Zn-dependent oxidoreductase
VDLRNEAFRYRRFGRPTEVLTLESAELAAPEPGVPRVRMTAAPINSSDLIPIGGAYRQRVNPPQVAGFSLHDWRRALACFHVPGRPAKPLLDLA